MTGTHDPQQDGSIREMLRDSGLDGSTELVDSLERLRALVPERAPAPRADLAALLAGGAREASTAGSSTSTATAVTTAMPAAAAQPDRAGNVLPPNVSTLADRRRSRGRRLAIAGGAVMGVMSLGAGAVAASSEDFRLTVSQSVEALFQPARHAPAPDHAQPSPADIPAIPAAPTAAAPAPSPTAPPAQGPGQPGPPAAGPASPAQDVPGAGQKAERRTQRPLAPGLPDVPGLPGLDGVQDGPLDPQLIPAPVAPAVPGSKPTTSTGQP